MISDKAKKKLLQELEKNGNVYWSCLKANMGRATFYRLQNSDKEFKKLADLAINNGRENNCDIAEWSLMLKVKDKDLGAIKYVLSHLSPRYKQKEIIILHKKENSENYEGYAQQKIAIKDMVRKSDEILHKHNIELKEKYENMGGIPTKADGTEIKDEELSDYNKYIEEWYKRKNIEESDK